MYTLIHRPVAIRWPRLPLLRLRPLPVDCLWEHFFIEGFLLVEASLLHVTVFFSLIAAGMTDSSLTLGSSNAAIYATGSCTSGSPLVAPRLPTRGQLGVDLVGGGSVRQIRHSAYLREPIDEPLCSWYLTLRQPHTYHGIIM